MILRNCVATRPYASALLDFRQFKQHIDKTAWETEVWVAEILDHLIHSMEISSSAPPRQAWRANDWELYI